MLPYAEVLLALPRSLGFGRAFWGGVLWRWKGLGLLHLHLAVGLALLPPTLALHQGFGRFAREEAPALFGQFPKILLEDGRVRVPETGAWLHPESGEALLIIDTTRRGPPRDGEPALLTREALWLRAGPLPPQRFGLPGLPLLLDAETMLGWVDSLRIGLAPLFYACALVVSVCWRLLWAFALLGPLTWLWGRSRGLSLGACLRLGAVAQTPGLLLGGLALSLGGSPLLWLPLASLVPVFWVIRAARIPR